MRRFFFNTAPNSNLASDDHSNLDLSLNPSTTQTYNTDFALVNDTNPSTKLGKLSVGTSLILSDDVYHHWCRVLRAKVGDQSVIFDGLGGEAVVELESINKKQATVKVHSFIATDRAATNYTQIGLVMSRGDRMDYAIQKSTELGVTVIQLLTSQHGEIRLKANQIDKKLNHWQQVALSACEQCGLNRPPLILSPLSIEAWLTGQSGKVHDSVRHLTGNEFYRTFLTSQTLKLALAVPSSKETEIFNIQSAIKDHINGYSSTSSIQLPSIAASYSTHNSIQNSVSEKSMSQKSQNLDNPDNHIQSNNLQSHKQRSRFDILVGPEGGLSQTEYTLSRQNNFLPWQIGNRVLRTETAPVVALTLLNFSPFII